MKKRGGAGLFSVVFKVEESNTGRVGVRNAIGREKARGEDDVVSSFPSFVTLLLKLCTHFTFWRRLGTGGGDVGKKRCCFLCEPRYQGRPLAVLLLSTNRDSETG